MFAEMKTYRSDNTLLQGTPQRQRKLPSGVFLLQIFIAPPATPDKAYREFRYSRGPHPPMGEGDSVFHGGPRRNTCSTVGKEGFSVIAFPGAVLTAGVLRPGQGATKLLCQQDQTKSGALLVEQRPAVMSLRPVVAALRSAGRLDPGPKPRS